MDKRVEITADDLPIEQALNQYYTFLKRVVSNSEGRVYLFNTIYPFDIYPIFRLCTTRTYSQTMRILFHQLREQSDPSISR